MPKDENDFWGFIAALFLGAVGLALLSSLFQPRCPQCNRAIEKGTIVCPHCGVYIRWTQ